MSRFFIIFIGLFWGLAVASETIVRDGLVVRVWQSQDGLPGNVVRSVVQTDDGYLWVVTAEGVARFDGYEFERIEPVGDLRRHQFEFSRLFATPGAVWVSASNGALYQSRDNRLVEVLGPAPQSNPSRVSQVIDGGEEAVLFRRGNEFGRIDANNRVTAIEDPGRHEAAFEADFNRQVEKGRDMGEGDGPELLDHAGRRWVADETGRLILMTSSPAPIGVEFPRRGAVFGVSEMHEDREGNVWVASPVNGLARIRPSRVERVNVTRGERSEQAFVSLMQDREGVWWFANRRGGVIQWTPRDVRHFVFPSGRPAAAIFEASDSRLWFASRDGSLYLKINGAIMPQFVETQRPSKVRSMVEGADGVLWFGGSQGLATLEQGGEIKSFGLEKGVPDAEFTVLAPFPGGKIIAGTADGRIIVGSRQGFATLSDGFETRNRWVSGILPVSANEVWVTTIGSGLLLWNGERWSSFGIDEGLPDARLTCVLADEQMNLWFGSLSGVVRAERQALLDRAEDPSKPLRWLLLDHTDGLPSRECVGGSQPAGWRADDGSLWFPTGGGIGRVQPDQVEPNEVAPPVYLQSARADGTVYDLGSDALRVGPGRSRIEFRFVGISLSAPEKTTYRVRLAGLDDSWRELGTQRFATFEAVPPGQYAFEVVAVNGDGVQSEVPAAMGFTVKPHLWQTAWFGALIVVAVLLTAIGSGWFAARRRLKRRIERLKIRSAREGERSRIARDLHDDLGSSLTEISILTSLAAEDARDTFGREVFDELTDKTKKLVSTLDEIVWAVNPREDTLRSLVDYLAAYAREYLESARLPLEVEIEGRIPDWGLAAPRRHGVFLAMREVLNNIVKHAKATAVDLHFQITPEWLEIRIHDNGVGFIPEYAAGGHGLGNLRARMREVDGSCVIESRPRGGSTITLTLKLYRSMPTLPQESKS